MAKKRIKILDHSNFEIDVVLSKTTYNLLIKYVLSEYNPAGGSWYLTIRDSAKNPLVSGIKVMPNQNLTKMFSYKDIFTDGDLWCLRLKADTSAVTRDNFGVGETYELVWISSQDAIQEELEGVIQL